MMQSISHSEYIFKLKILHTITESIKSNNFLLIKDKKIRRLANHLMHEIQLYRSKRRSRGPQTFEELLDHYTDIIAKRNRMSSAHRSGIRVSDNRYQPKHSVVISKDLIDFLSGGRIPEYRVTQAKLITNKPPHVKIFKIGIYHDRKIYFIGKYGDKYRTPPCTTFDKVEQELKRLIIRTTMRNLVK